MPAGISGPLIVIGIFVLLGAMIGADVSLWPWDEPLSFLWPLAIGTSIGFVVGIAIVWRVRHAEGLS
jgi:hypothetical protein